MRKRKFGNKSCRCLLKHIHDSILEADVCNRLLAKVKAKEIDSYVSQKTYDLTANYKTICQHRVDFLVYHKNGELEVVEAKGMATALWRLKKKIFESAFPDINYRVITRANLHEL